MVYLQSLQEGVACPGFYKSKNLESVRQHCMMMVLCGETQNCRVGSLSDRKHKGKPSDTCATSMQYSKRVDVFGSNLPITSVEILVAYVSDTGQQCEALLAP